MNAPVTFDPVWEEKYAAGHGQRYPWDAVVSFVFRNAPRDRPRETVRILELGCGTGANLWFAAREGYAVAGVDASASAIAAARRRFGEEGLAGDLRVGDFTRLPYEDDSFDCAIDRASLTCCGSAALRAAVAEIRRVLRPGGRFFFNPYADSHSSARTGRAAGDGLTVDITGGTLVGVGQIHFVARHEVTELFAEGWTLKQLERLEITDMLGPQGSIHAEWRVLAEKTP